jgi:Tol biopolymer transport system component
MRVMRFLRGFMVVSVVLWLLLTLLTGSAVTFGWLERRIGGRSELAYVLNAGITTEVLLLDTRRAMTLQLGLLNRNTTVAGGSTGSDLFWSPDGQRLAYVQQTNNGDDAIVVVDLRTQMQLVRAIDGLGGRLGWSADGTHLVYSRFNSQRQWNLYAIETAELVDLALAVLPLTTRGRNSYNGLWSPDGRWLAYQTGEVSDEARTLFLADGDAPAMPMTQPPFSVVGGLAFSPDSTHLIFTAMMGGEDQQQVVPPVDLYLLRLSEVREKVSPSLIPLTDKIGHVNSPAWSPDGRQVAFVLFHESGKTLYLVDGILDGRLTEPQALTSGAFTEVSSPSWSPDGRQLAFIGSTGGGWLDVYTVNPISREIRTVTNTTLRERSPVWRPLTSD